MDLLFYYLHFTSTYIGLVYHLKRSSAPANRIWAYLVLYWYLVLRKYPHILIEVCKWRTM